MNNKNPNSKLDITQTSDSIEQFVNSVKRPSLSTVTLGQGKKYLLQLEVDELNNKILYQLADDMISTLTTWLEDPEVLCCLVHAIWDGFFRKSNEEFELGIANTSFANFLDDIITVVDIILAFVTNDIKESFEFVMEDIIKIFMDTILGATLTVVQEISGALRDTFLNMVFNWIDDFDTEETWTECLPMKELINVIKKYIHDYGILSEIFEKVQAYIGASSNKWKKSMEAPVKTKDLEFLYWFRDLLVKLKRSVVNFDFCVNYQYVPTNGDNVSGNVNNASNERITSIEKINNPDIARQSSSSPHQGYTIESDGTILVNKDKLKDDNGMWIPRVSNSFIRDFLHDEYNMSYQAIDNIINTGTSSDSIQGTVTNNEKLMDKCANVPSSKQILEGILNIDRTS